MPGLRESGAADYPSVVVVRVRRRLAAAHGLEAFALAVLAAGIAGAIGRVVGTSAAVTTAVVALSAVVAWFWSRRTGRTAAAAALAIEGANPHFQNLIVTAVELSAYPDRSRRWIRERVFADAERRLADINPRTIVPLHRRVAGCAVAAGAAVWLVVSVDERTATLVVETLEKTSRGAASGSHPAIVATLQPPAHTQLPIASVVQPARIDAVEGTRLHLSIRGGGTIGVRVGSRGVPTRAEGHATVAELTLRESGYVAVESDTTPILIPVTVAPDRAPTIVVRKPGRDLLMSTTTVSVPVEASATDDFGLALLGLRYTRVSGSGEQFEFVEGELPIDVVRRDARSWQGRGALSLSRLGLQAGDSLVYRVVARDGRAGEEGFAFSDTFVVEVAGPGQVALEGFEMPPDRDRHALSQQMIVLKIRRLRERERALARDALREQTGAIAAEQRAVRGNFVFLTGGHVEDEEEEAEQSHEIQEGRLENTARQEIARAIGHMSLAEQALAAVDTAVALKEATLAVDALQRAFGKNRYLLRTLPVRSRVDPSRRLTGTLDEAGSWNRTLSEPTRDRRQDAARELLAELIAIGEDLKRMGPSDLEARVSGLPERALAIDPGDAAWQQISAGLTGLRDTVTARHPQAVVAGRLQEAMQRVLSRTQLSSTPSGPGGASPGGLRGAWADELRRGPQSRERPR